MAYDYGKMLEEQTGSFGDYGYDLTKNAFDRNLLSKLGTDRYTNAAKGLAGSGLKRNAFGMLDDEDYLGMKGSTWQGLGTGVQLGLGALNTWGGLEELGLAKDAFNFNKNMAEKEYAMAKDAYDRNVKRSEHVASQMNRRAETLPA